MKRMILVLGTALVLSGCGEGGTGGQDEPMTDSSATALDTNVPIASPTVQTPRPQTPLGGETTPPQTGGGNALAQQVETAIRLSGAAQQVTVSAQNGVVTLRGTLSSREEADRLLGQARNVPGVQSVRDELTIQEAGQPVPAQPRPPSQN